MFVERPETTIQKPSLGVPIHQAKAVLGTVNSEMKPDEMRKFKFVY